MEFLVNHLAWFLYGALVLNMLVAFSIYLIFIWPLMREGEISGDFTKLRGRPLSVLTIQVYVMWFQFIASSLVLDWVDTGSPQNVILYVLIGLATIAFQIFKKRRGWYFA